MATVANHLIPLGVHVARNLLKRAYVQDGGTLMAIIEQSRWRQLNRYYRACHDGVTLMATTEHFMMALP